MATTGTRILCGNSTLVTAASTIVGQGDKPDLWVLYSTDDASASIPTWADATPKVRAFSTSRGRESELDRVDAGSASIVLDARDRTFDPIATATLRPMNRWWIRSQFSGSTRDLFKGYAQSYDIGFPAYGKDATTTVNCTDEFGPLALERLPAPSVFNDYSDTVMFDNPAGYWPMHSGDREFALDTKIEEAAVGVSLVGVNTVSNTGLIDQGAIIGDNGGSLRVQGNAYFITPPLNAGESGDAGDLSEFTIEGWFTGYDGALGSFPASQRNLLQGPESGGTYTWKLEVTTAGLFKLSVKNSGGTAHIVTSTSTLGGPQLGNDPLQLGWTHVVGTINGGSLRIYINGVEEDSTAWTGVVGAIDPGTFGVLSIANGMTLGDLGNDITPEHQGYEQIAFYRQGLTAARIADHYDAGRERGFGSASFPGFRLLAVLDKITSQAPRSIRNSGYLVAGAFMVGQPVIDELRKAESVSGGDSVLFIASDGTLTFLDAGHRSFSPWDTVQVTFDDTGVSGLTYTDIGLDYSDSYLYNEWNVTNERGLTKTAIDDTSVATYGKRSQSLTLSVFVDLSADAIAADMLAKYKDPFVRVSWLSLQTVLPAVTDAALGFEIGDRIRVIKAHPGGGSPIDQTLFVQKIEISAQPEPPWDITLQVSPL